MFTPPNLARKFNAYGNDAASQAGQSLMQTSVTEDLNAIACSRLGDITPSILVGGLALSSLECFIVLYLLRAVRGTGKHRGPITIQTFVHELQCSYALKLNITFVRYDD